MDSNNERLDPVGQRKSLWTSTCEMKERPTLTKDFTETEAIVIGAGLAGLLTAYMLQDKGIETMVIESNRIGSGTSAYTTGKITAQHNLIYDRLISGPGIEKARQYATANMEAINSFQSLADKESIDCSYEKKPSYLYTMKKESIDLLKKEAQAATKLGIPNAFLKEEDLAKSTEWALPHPAKAALVFFEQAQYHPLKFMEGIAKNLRIYEKTRAIDVELGGSKTASQKSEKSLVFTEAGKISAQYVVFTCHFPFLIMPGYYFARMYQDRTYIIALDGGPQINGLYLGIDQPIWSFRNHENYLLVVGAAHRTGENKVGGEYENIRKEALKWFPDGLEKYSWSTQDCMPLDGIPYIGQYASDRPNWYIATGFQKWGMSSSMVAADIISSSISQTPFRVAIEGDDVFSPHRFTVPTSAKEMWDDVKIISGGLYNGAFSPHEEVGKCSHMGCQLSWNPEEKSWDCPCHGSRFTIDGEVISGPAIKAPGTLGSSKKGVDLQ